MLPDYLEHLSEDARQILTALYNLNQTEQMIENTLQHCDISDQSIYREWKRKKRNMDLLEKLSPTLKFTVQPVIESTLHLRKKIDLLKSKKAQMKIQEQNDIDEWILAVYSEQNNNELLREFAFFDILSANAKTIVQPILLKADDEFLKDVEDTLRVIGGNDFGVFIDWKNKNQPSTEALQENETNSDAPFVGGQNQKLHPSDNDEEEGNKLGKGRDKKEKQRKKKKEPKQKESGKEKQEHNSATYDTTEVIPEKQKILPDFLEQLSADARNIIAGFYMQDGWDDMVELFVAKFSLADQNVYNQWKIQNRDNVLLQQISLKLQELVKPILESRVFVLTTKIEMLTLIKTRMEKLETEAVDDWIFATKASTGQNTDSVEDQRNGNETNYETGISSVTSINEEKPEGGFHVQTLQKPAVPSNSADKLAELRLKTMIELLSPQISEIIQYLEHYFTWNEETKLDKISGIEDCAICRIATTSIFHATNPSNACTYYQRRGHHLHLPRGYKLTRMRPVYPKNNEKISLTKDELDSYNKFLLAVQMWLKTEISKHPVFQKWIPMEDSALVLQKVKNKLREKCLRPCSINDVRSTLENLEKGKLFGESITFTRKIIEHHFLSIES